MATATVTHHYYTYISRYVQKTILPAYLPIGM